MIIEHSNIISELIPIILDKVKKQRLKIIEPTKKQRKDIIFYIYQFLKQYKRIVYGGMAQDILLKRKSKNKMEVYGKYDAPDIEFYSPDPLVDMINLCDLLNNNNIPTEGSEAQHQNTYTIFCYYENICDITFMPIEINNILPYIELHKIRYIHPNFMYKTIE